MVSSKDASGHYLWFHWRLLGRKIEHQPQVISVWCWCGTFEKSSAPGGVFKLYSLISCIFLFWNQNISITFLWPSKLVATSGQLWQVAFVPHFRGASCQTGKTLALVGSLLSYGVWWGGTGSWLTGQGSQTPTFTEVKCWHFYSVSLRDYLRRFCVWVLLLEYQGRHSRDNLPTSSWLGTCQCSQNPSQGQGNIATGGYPCAGLL